MQPTIQKIYKSRQIEESLLVWKNGKNNAANNYYDYLKANASSVLGGTSFNKALYNGFNTSANATTLSYAGGNAAQAVAVGEREVSQQGHAVDVAVQAQRFTAIEIRGAAEQLGAALAGTLAGA